MFRTFHNERFHLIQRQMSHQDVGIEGNCRYVKGRGPSESYGTYAPEMGDEKSKIKNRPGKRDTVLVLLVYIYVVEGYVRS